MSKIRAGVMLAGAVLGVVALGTVVVLHAQKQSVVGTPSDPGVAVTVGEPTTAFEGPSVTIAAGPDQVATILAAGPQIGVQIRDVAEDEVAKLKLPAAGGVVVESVSAGTPAEKAGVKAGDAIVEFDGERIRSVAQLTRLVRESAEGRELKMAVYRDGKRLDLSVTPVAGTVGAWTTRVPDLEPRLREFSERFERDVRPRLERELPRLQREYRFESLPEGRFRVLPRGELGDTFPLLMRPGRGRLGIGIEDLEGQLAEYFGTKNGVLVRSVDEGSPAAKAGIKAGDVITAVNGEAVKDVDTLLDRLGQAEDGAEVSIGLVRDRKSVTLKATLEPRETVRRRFGRGIGPLV